MLFKVDAITYQIVKFILAYEYARKFRNRKKVLSCFQIDGDLHYFLIESLVFP